MKVGRRLAVAAGLASLAVALVAGSASPAPSRPAAVPKLTSPPRQLVEFGYVRSLVPKGNRFEMRFDPALWLGGATANRAAIEDGVIGPGQTVPNDYYIRNEDRRPLTYFVPRSARVTVLTNPGTGPRSTRITVAELAQIVKGNNPRGRPLYDPGRHLGYWLRVTTDTAVALDQQYQP